jgi:hypothetical protein
MSRFSDYSSSTFEAKNGEPYIMKFNYTPEKIMICLSKEVLGMLEKEWGKHDEGLTCNEFVELMLSHIATKNDE